jgi:hypothetical protein
VSLTMSSPSPSTLDSLREAVQFQYMLVRPWMNVWLPVTLASLDLRIERGNRSEVHKERGFLPVTYYFAECSGYSSPLSLSLM